MNQLPAENFKVKKAVRHHYDRVIKIDVTRVGIGGHCVLSGVRQPKEHSSAFVVFLPMMHDLSLVVRTLYIGPGENHLVD